MTEAQTQEKPAPEKVAQEKAALDRMSIVPPAPDATDAGTREQNMDDPHTEQRGAQERPMTEAETLQEALEDSMDASDPPAIVHPGTGDPALSSGFDAEEEKRLAEEAARKADVA